MAGATRDARDATLWMKANKLADEKLFDRTSPIGKVKAYIAQAQGEKASGSKPAVAKKTAKGSVAKKTAKSKSAAKRSTGSTRKASGTSARKASTGTAKRGRPAGTRNSRSTKRTPATTAKRSATASRNSKQTRRRVQADEPGRNTVPARLRWNVAGYNPREGSVAYEVFQVVKQVKGDREEAFRILRKRVKTLFRGYDQEKALQLLRYRISRVIWDYAQATGQHEKSDNRIEYGTGENTSVYKRGVAGNRGRPPANGRRTSARGTAKRGRPAKAASKSTRKGTRARGKAKAGSRR